jgi:DNA-binding NtrC family response regulator
VATPTLLSAHAAPPLVLVVDDEPSVRHVLDRLLAFHRFTARQAASVSEATAIAEREPIDAFIVDLSLGRDRSGLDMVDWVRRQRDYESAPVFLLTGNLDIPVEEERRIHQQAAQVFYKGQSLEFLIDCLRRVLTDAKRAPA